MQKITIAENKEFTKRFPTEMVTEIKLKTRSGDTHVEVAAYPRGHAKNPMTDGEIDDKFRNLSAGMLKPADQKALLQSLWEVDQARSIGQVLERIRVDR